MRDCIFEDKIDKIVSFSKQFIIFAYYRLSLPLLSPTSLP
jgi:hypothetical protein